MLQNHGCHVGDLLLQVLINEASCTWSCLIPVIFSFDLLPLQDHRCAVKECKTPLVSQVDVVLHPLKSELNFPYGPKDQGRTRARSSKVERG